MGHHPAMDGDIDGDEGDADAVRARPSHYNKSVAMVGAITLFCFVVTDDKRYSPMWQRWKWHVVDDLANEFAQQTHESPRILGFAAGFYEFMAVPVDEDNKEFAAMRKAAYTQSKRRLGELRGWLVWRALSWAFTDDDLVEKAHGHPPHIPCY